MSMPPEDIERTRSAVEKPAADLYFNLVISFIWFIALVWFIARMMGESGVRLRVLHYSLQSLQAIARWVGVMALLLEQQYNDTASNLH
jgi:hypothetical protein